MYHQPFAGADMGYNRVAGDRPAAFGKGDKHAVGAFDRQRARAARRRQVDRSPCKFLAITTLIALPRPISASKSSSVASFILSSSR